MWRRRIRWTVAVSLSCSVFAVGGAEAAHAQGAAEPTVTLEGIVSLSDGQPAAGAEVLVRLSLESVFTRTGDDGQFSLEVPAPRARGAIIEAIGPSGNLGHIQLPWDLDLDASELTSPPIQLTAPRILNVTVVDADGRAVPGAEVAVVADFHARATEVADASGRVALAVPQDIPLQFVLAAKAGVGVDYILFRDERAPASDPYQLPPDHAEPIELTLAPTRTVTVHVVDQSGKPVPGASVTPWLLRLPKKGDSANLGSLWTTITDAAGKAAFPHIPVESDGTLTFWVRKDGLVAPERTNLEKESAEATLTATLLPLVPVSGRVVRGDGSPAAGVEVRAAGAGHGFDYSYRGQTTTGADGTFRLDVSPDQYCLFVAGDDEHASPAVARIVRGGKPIENLELMLGPATRVFGQLTAAGRPAAGQYVQLYQKDAPHYYSLPEADRLPNPKDSRVALTPRLVQSTQTDDEGRFEFFAGPGEFYLISQNVADAPTFTIADQAELDFRLAAKASPDARLAGRVVLAADPERGVAEATVFSYPEDLAGRHVRATTDAQGRFEDRVPGAASLIGAFSEDRELGAVVRMAADQQDVVLALAPTAVVSGILVDEETGEPAAGQELGAAIRVGPEGGPFMHAFKRDATTGDDGRFAIAGLVPGHNYDVQAVTQRDADGQPRGWRNIGAAAPADAGDLDLGELRMPPPYRAPTVEDDIERAYAHEDPTERLERLLADAKLAFGQVLVVAANPEAKPARRYFEICWHNPMQPNELIPPNFREYMVLAVDPAIAGDEFFTQNNISVAAAGGLTLAILNPDGAVVAQTTDVDLSTDGQLDAELLAEFLANRRAPLPSARRVLDEALAEAARDEKRVLVQVGGPGCSWCVVLARYLDGQKELVAKDYIHLKLDSRMPAADEVIGQLRKVEEGGIPWMAILDASGRTLITSDGPDGNIGYPGEPKSREHWEHMLRTTRQRMTDAELTAVLAPLEE